MTPAEFIARWKDSGGAELANSQSFLKELCELLDVPQPEPTLPDETKNLYTFEKAVEFNNGDGTTSSGRVDLYRQKCFVLESKQGAERREKEQADSLATVTRSKKFRAGTAERGKPGWEQAMTKARLQAKRYAEALPGEWSPFLIVADVGYCFDVYADFTQSGKNYNQFPDPQSYRIKLADLEKVETREFLRAIWLDPHSLDPSKRAAKVTRDLAKNLAELAKRFEKEHSPDDVAHFLMRCLFTMFAEDVRLIRKNSFRELLESLRTDRQNFVPMLTSLWQTMDKGGFSPILREHIKQFNGGLFEDQTAFPLTEDQLELLIEAAKADWKEVEPAIFGTLLERALDPVERHKLGAHYTPRAYVERLVMPTIMEPLREDWATVYATASKLYDDGKTKDAVAEVRKFHGKLCDTTILDPACGSGNFLYVSLELMKRLEGEVLNTLREFGDRQPVLLTVDPHQFLGIEVNPRAAAITDLVLWIGYLQWHFRTRGTDPLNEPIIRKFHNIECRDAVLAWDSIELMVDAEGKPVTRWDGRTTKPHPVTGEEVPDEASRVQEMRFVNPRKAEWPNADYIVGNPPYLGARTNRLALGDGYLLALRAAYPDVPENVDYVMYWWRNAAELARNIEVSRFGLITTKSISQSFAQALVRPYFEDGSNISFRFAVPNHPWVDAADGADVRVAITVCDASGRNGTVFKVAEETLTESGESEVRFVVRSGCIQSNLTIGADTDSCIPLFANQKLSCVGYQLTGQGFVVSSIEAENLGYHTDKSLDDIIRPLRTARDLAQKSRNLLAIDLYGESAEHISRSWPKLYQWILNRVKPERDQNNRRAVREKWWLYGECRSTFRPALKDISRMAVTPLTAKFRYFVYTSPTTVCDSTTVMISISEADAFGVLSSKIHQHWALAAGGRLGVGNDPRYNKTRCFETFPFPVPSDATKQRIRELGEQLDAHRKRQQELHPDLTMTGMYNVLEKLRSGEALTAKEKTIHDQGLVSVLKQIHDDLDAAVFDAYGWPHDLTDEQILEKLVALNHERAEEEKRGLIRWLRPEFQNPQGADKKSQKKLAIEAEEDEPEAKPAKAAKKPAKLPWPEKLPDRIKAIRDALTTNAKPATPADIAKLFKSAKKDTVEELLETLTAIGQARLTDDGKYVA